jgi:hypothetical protein
MPSKKSFWIPSASSGPNISLQRPEKAKITLKRKCCSVLVLLALLVLLVQVLLVLLVLLVLTCRPE